MQPKDGLSAPFAPEIPIEVDRPYPETGRPTSVKLIVAATFTAEPLRQPLDFWAGTLNIPVSIVFAPYAQLMQQLLEERSLLSSNHKGLNVILLRPEDWLRDLDSTVSEHLKSSLIRTSTQEFTAALESFSLRNSAMLLLFLCPPANSANADWKSDSDRYIAKKCSDLPNVHCFTHADLVALYPVADCHDRRADRLGHVPYTDEYFCALATRIARWMAMSYKPPRKVIAVDCDNTLWHGICGEVGAVGIELTSSHLRLQDLLRNQYDQGMLLCLCSKNNSGDVDAVFASRSDMTLTPSHFIASRVNWLPKSANLRSLAQELDLSLDSFMFIDDDPFECAEVKTNCPSVLALQFPRDPAEVPRFLEHNWAFDRNRVNGSAKPRSEQYRANQQRKAALETAPSIQEFLSSLNLVVSVKPAAASELGRVAELLARTNQFNLTTIRRSLSEVTALFRENTFIVLVVHAADRFGDYGLVGTLFLRAGDTSLEVDTFILSCRALGRGVEYRVTNELARMAQEANKETISFPFRPTSRNRPAGRFLMDAFGQFKHSLLTDAPDSGEAIFIVPTQHAAQLTANYLLEGSTDETDKSNTEERPTQNSGRAVGWYEDSYRLSHIPDLLREVRRSLSPSPIQTQLSASPTSATEAMALEIVREVASLTEVGLHQDLFALGVDSVQAVRVISRISAALNVDLPLTAIFENPTIASLSSEVDKHRPSATKFDSLRSDNLARDISEHISTLSGDEVLARLAELEQEVARERRTKPADLD